jgi:hypothetical protein
MRHGPLFIATLLLIAPLAARAEDDRKGGPRPNGSGPGFRGENDRGPGPGGPGGFGGFGRRGGGDWDDDDQRRWDKVKEGFTAFSEQNTPNFARFALSKFGLKGFDEAMKRGSGFHRRMAKRYVELVDLKERASELHPIKLKQMQVEDAEVGILHQIREAKQSNDAAKVEELKQQLRGKAQEHVQARLDEREYRIKELASSIEKERKKLADDRSNPAALIDARVGELENFGRPHKGRDKGESKGGDNKNGTDKPDDGKGR